MSSTCLASSFAPRSWATPGDRYRHQHASDVTRIAPLYQRVIQFESRHEQKRSPSAPAGADSLMTVIGEIREVSYYEVVPLVLILDSGRSMRCHGVRLLKSEPDWSWAQAIVGIVQVISEAHPQEPETKRR